MVNEGFGMLERGFKRRSVGGVGVTRMWMVGQEHLWSTRKCTCVTRPRSPGTMHAPSSTHRRLRVRDAEEAMHMSRGDTAVQQLNSLTNLQVCVRACVRVCVCGRNGKGKRVWG
jgi:hypothetical protein